MCFSRDIIKILFGLKILACLPVLVSSEGQIEEFCDCPTNRAGEIKEMFQDFVEHFNKTSEDFETCLAENTERLKEIRSKNRNCIGNSVSDCRDALAGFGQNGVYLIDPSLYFRYNYYAPCRNDLMGGGWMVVLRRLDGRYSFDKNWINYRDGFGNLDHEFFIGLDRLHATTSVSTQELLIWLQIGKDNRPEYAKYDSFEVASEKKGFTLKLGNYTGTSDDFFSYHSGHKFSTKDKLNFVNNDTCSVNTKNEFLCKPCMETIVGGWWHFGCCTIFFLTDLYKTGSNRGIYTKTGKNYFSIEMMIREREK